MRAIFDDQIKRGPLVGPNYARDEIERYGLVVRAFEANSSSGHSSLDNVMAVSLGEPLKLAGDHVPIVFVIS